MISSQLLHEAVGVWNNRLCNLYLGFPGKVNVRTKLKLKSFVEKFYSSNTNSSRRRVTLKRKKNLDLLMQLSPQNINLKYFLLWRRH